MDCQLLYYLIYLIRMLLAWLFIRRLLWIPEIAPIRYQSSR